MEHSLSYPNATLAHPHTALLEAYKTTLPHSRTFRLSSLTEDLSKLMK